MKRNLGRFIYWFIGPIAFPLMLRNTRRSRVIIEVDGHILLVKSMVSRQSWNLPGGGSAKHESDRDCAVREIIEETGIQLKAAALREIGNRRYTSINTPYTCLFFDVVLPERPEIKKGFDILDAAWYPISNLPEATHQAVFDGLKLR